jgi:hypothetical protein
MQERIDGTLSVPTWTGAAENEPAGPATKRPAPRFRIVAGRDVLACGGSGGRPLGPVERSRLARLAGRLRIAGVGAPAEDRNAGLPAGYAYLAQFVANDLPGAPPAPHRGEDARTVAEIGALLQRFHSAVRDAVVIGGAPGRGRRFARQADLVAATALATRAYHRIVADDLLARVLDPAIHRVQRDRARCALGRRQAPEAASVAGWLGSMLASRRPPAPGIAGRIGRVDWSRLFEIGPEAPDPSRLLMPVIPAESEAEAGRWETVEDSPLYREMVRAGSGFRPVGTLLEELGLDGPEQPRLLAEPAYRRTVLAEWLALPAGLGIPSYRLSPEDVEALAGDPPLPFFLLFEAMVLGQGRRLGPLGSTLIADALLARATRARAPDGWSDPGLERQVFPTGLPGSMPDLIRYVEG